MLRPLRTGIGTDQRSARLRQSGQVSKGKQTHPRGSWEAAATAGSDPATDIAPPGTSRCNNYFSAGVRDLILWHPRRSGVA